MKVIKLCSPHVLHVSLTDCVYTGKKGLQKRVKTNGKIGNIFPNKDKIYNFLKLFWSDKPAQLSLCIIIILPSGYSTSFLFYKHIASEPKFGKC